MDMSKFVKSLSNSEIEELQKCLTKESITRFNVSNFPPLNSEEIALLTTKGKVSAILAYRNRTSQTVLISKLVVESLWSKLAKPRKQHIFNQGDFNL